MCDKVVSKKPIMLKYCPDRYKTQKMCEKAIDTCLSTLKFVPDCLDTSKILEMFHNSVFSNDDVDLDFIDSDIVTFFSDDMDINIQTLIILTLVIMMIMILKL